MLAKLYCKLIHPLVILFALCSLLLTGCGWNDTKDLQFSPPKPRTVKPSIVIKVAYDNKIGEPFDYGMRRWQDLVKERSNGTMILELYPEGKLGDRESILNRMSNGENIATVLDGAYFYEKGVVEMGAMLGPFLFNSWDEVFQLTHSKWYQDQIEEVNKKLGYRIISTDWAYGVRHILTTRPLVTADDLQGLRIRIPPTLIQEKSFEVLGAQPVKLPLGKVNEALANKDIDGLENPLSIIYSNQLHRGNAKYLLLSEHSFNFVNILIGNKTYSKLSSAQKRILKTTCDRAAKFYNVVQDAVDSEILRKMEAEGVTVTSPSPELYGKLHREANSFYYLSELGWSPSLYLNLLRAKALPMKSSKSEVNQLIYEERAKRRKQQEAQKKAQEEAKKQSLLEQAKIQAATTPAPILSEVVATDNVVSTTEAEEVDHTKDVSLESVFGLDNKNETETTTPATAE